MAHFGTGVEQALHFLLFLARDEKKVRPSARDAADYYRLSPGVAAKVFTRLEKARLVAAEEGREGGFRLARPLSRITVLEVADAIEGRKKLFQCREIRGRCAIFEKAAPAWATTGLCAIHAAMNEAEETMRRKLAATTLQDIRDRAAQTIPQSYRAAGDAWLAERRAARRRRKTEETSA
ncbi:MAG: Rrf2 family transcriptional regulator [Beijerinckiaceae bacterium]